MISVHDMHSPIDSPFLNDFDMNYTDPLTAQQTSQFQSRIILQYTINHSLHLILQSYCDKFHWEMEQLQRMGLVTFTSTIAKRSSLTLQQFQRVCIVLSRFLDQTESVDITLKQLILGVIVAVQGFESKQWDRITGMPLPSLAYILRYLALDEHDLYIEEMELKMINEKMKSLIYARFNVV